MGMSARRRAFRLLLALALPLAASTSVYSQTNVWNGLQPLRSSKIDVEKKLGKPKPPRYINDFRYDVDGKIVTIDYSGRQCDRGWNVPKETVLSIIVPPLADQNKNANQLGLKEKGFSVSGDDAFYGTWTNADLGIQYYFGNISEDFLWTKYIPTRIDNQLRCDGFPPFAPEGQHYGESTFFYDPREGKDGGFDAVFSWVYNTLVLVKESDGKYNAFALVYFDNKKPYPFYARRLKELRTVASRITSDVGQKIEIIEAGNNFENRVYLYVLPKGYEPPAPDPQLPSPYFSKRKK